MLKDIGNNRQFYIKNNKLKSVLSVVKTDEYGIKYYWRELTLYILNYAMPKYEIHMSVK